MKIIINIIFLCTLVFGIEHLINEKALLFYINKSQPLLNINTNDDLHRSEADIKLKKYFNSIFDSYQIEPWLNSATANDCSGDICLNRIYKIRFNDLNNRSLTQIKNHLEFFSFIDYVEYDYLRQLSYEPNDPRYNQQWFLPQVQANYAWDFWDIPNDMPGSRDVLLASVDTGVDWDHNDLVDNIWQNLGEDADGDGHTLEYIDGDWVFDPDDLNNIDDDDWDNNPNTYIDDLIGWDPSGLNGLDDNDPRPKDGVNSGGTWAHGTHVAGLLAASTDNNNGIASVGFNCSIMSVKVSRDNQEGEPYITDGYDGILYAAKAGHYSSDRGFAIINNSWGGGGFNIFEQSVINVAHDDYDAIIFAAAGNGSDYGGEEYSAHYPSSYANVISVTALGTGDNWNHWATYHETVDLGAPGEDITSTVIQNNNSNNAYRDWWGTSMATPIAASCSGLLSAFNPSWNNQHLETMIVATSDPNIYNVNQEEHLVNRLGHGRVDAFRALLTPLFPQINIAAIDYQIIGGTDNIIDAGESFNLSFILFNEPDWGVASNTSIVLSSLSNYFNIANPVQYIGGINPGDVYINSDNPFEIDVLENIPSGNYEFELAISSNDTDYATYNIKDTVSISVNNSSLSSKDFMAKEFKISNPFPNPFNPSTTLSWELNSSGHMLIEVYNLNGLKLDVLTNSYYHSGFHTFLWNPSSFVNGIYFIKYSFKDSYFIQKITLLK